MSYDKRITDIAAMAAQAAGKNAKVAPQLLLADITFTLADAIESGALLLPPAALALPHPVGDRESIALTEATELAKAMWLRWYRKDAPDWQPLGTVRGVISQIDNMSAGMVRAPDPLALSPTAAVPEGFGCVGVTRMFDNDKALLCSFREPPTDDQLRQIHDILGGHNA